MGFSPNWLGAGGGYLGGGLAGFSIGGPVGAGVGAVLGGLGGLFMGGKKKQDDPLAGIRAQLQALYTQVPDLVNKQKELIKQSYGDIQEQGLSDIGEQYQAGKGFGKGSTMENQARSKLMNDIARSLAADELAAEQWGLGAKESILKSEMGTYPAPTDTTEPAFGESLLGVGGQILGQQLGLQSLKNLYGGGGKDLMDVTDLTNTDLGKKAALLTNRVGTLYA